MERSGYTWCEPHHNVFVLMILIGSYSDSEVTRNVPMLYYHWGSRSSETACNRAPASWLGEGESRGTGIMIGNGKQRSVLQLSYYARSPPLPLSNVVDNNNKMTSRRIHTRRVCLVCCCVLLPVLNGICSAVINRCKVPACR